MVKVLYSVENVAKTENLSEIGLKDVTKLSLV
jgi:hypothetical protein